VRRYFAVPISRSDSRCGERCVEGVDLGESRLDGIEQWDISVDAAVIYAAVRSMAAELEAVLSTFGRRSRISCRITPMYGLPADSPEFWRAASLRPYCTALVRQASRFSPTSIESTEAG
jgi:hypothetical protein